MRALSHRRGDTASSGSPRTPLPLWSIAPRTPFGKPGRGDPFTSLAGETQCLVPPGHPQHSPPRRTVLKPLTSLPLSDSEPAASGVPVPLACVLVPGEPQPPVPLLWLEKRPTAQTPGSRQSLRASALCLELPLAGRPDHLAHFAVPRLPGSSQGSYYLPRGQGTGRGGPGGERH